MSGAKTEEPTPRRLRRAREEGDSGASLFASQALGLVAAVALVPATLGAGAALVEARLRDAIQQAARTTAPVHFDAGAGARDLLLLCAPILAGVALTSAASAIVQNGGLLGAKRLLPRLDRLNPIAGLARLASGERFFAVARALAGAGLVAWLVARELRTGALDVARTSGRLAFVAPAALTLGRRIAWDAALLGLGLALVDVVVVRAGWRKRLRMSRVEVQRELKETGGDRAAKESRERARAEVASQGILTGPAGVARATVVIHAGRRFACALAYEEGDRAPRVIAAGEGASADAILQVARSYGVAAAENAEVARALAPLAPGEELPESLFDAVAEILRDTAYAPS